MFDLTCKNKECLGSTTNKQVVRITQKYIDGEIKLYPMHYCEWCGSEMEVLPKNQGFGTYNRFDGLSDEGKKEVLKKRADAHYNKKGKEQKREFFKKTMNNLKK